MASEKGKGRGEVQRGREKSVCMREREGASYKESASLRATQGSGDKLHLKNSIFTSARWLYANTQKLCVLMHLWSARVHLHVQCEHAARSRNKITPQEALKGFYYCIWTSDWWCYMHNSELHWIINNIWWISNTRLYVILSSCDCACVCLLWFLLLNNICVSWGISAFPFFSSGRLCNG